MYKRQDQNIKAFDPIARKSGLDYNVKKIENGKPPTYLVSFKGKDIDVMTEAFREFTAKKLGRDKKPSIRKLLSTLKDKAAALNAQKDLSLIHIFQSGAPIWKLHFSLINEAEM